MARMRLSGLLTPAAAYAFAIGFLVVAAERISFGLLTGRPVVLASGVNLTSALLVSIPFLALALVRAEAAAWLTALAMTLGLWGYALLVGVRSPGPPPISLGLIILASPLFITAICLAVHWNQRKRAQATGAAQAE